jgi:elongation factor Ts
VLVELGGVDPADAKAREVAHDVALHIASAAPRWVTRDEVPADVIERERKIYESLAREEGKPEAAWPKIIDGKINGFYKANPGGALVEQSFVKDQKSTVGALVAGLGGSAAVRRFARVKIGEE